MIEQIIERIVIGIWFFIPVAELIAGFLLCRVSRKRESDISGTAGFLCMVFILWSIVSVIVWRDNVKIELLRETYRAQVKTEGIDENGDLWITIEAENAERVYSAERGDNVLYLAEEGAVPCDYPVGKGVNTKTQYYWRYQVTGAGECELIKIRTHFWENDEVVAYRIAVDGNGNITKTAEYGEMPEWLEADEYKGNDYVDKAYDSFVKNVIFLYGENLAEKETEMSGELYRISLNRNRAGRSNPVVLYICPDIRRIYHYYTKADDTKVWEEFRISDNCDISWIKEWGDEYYQDDSTDLLEY